MDHRTVREVSLARPPADLTPSLNEQESRRNWTRITFLFSRLFLGGVFLYASYDKILHPAAFAEVIYNYQVLPEILINLVAVVLPWLEILVGVSLLLGVWLLGSVFMCNSLLLLFFSALVFNMARGLDIDCGCFTVSVGPSSGGHMLWYLFRDGFFLVLALYLLVVNFLVNAIVKGPRSWGSKGTIFVIRTFAK